MPLGGADVGHRLHDLVLGRQRRGQASVSCRVARSRSTTASAVRCRWWARGSSGGGRGSQGRYPARATGDVRTPETAVFTDSSGLGRRQPSEASSTISTDARSMIVIAVTGARAGRRPRWCCGPGAGAGSSEVGTWLVSSATFRCHDARTRGAPPCVRPLLTRVAARRQTPPPIAWQMSPDAVTSCSATVHGRWGSEAEEPRYDAAIERPRGSRACRLGERCDLVDDHQVAGDLVGRRAGCGSARRARRASAGRVAVAGLDDGAHGLAPALVGHADHQHVVDLGVGLQDGLDLLGVDLLAAGVDADRAAAEQGDRAVGLDGGRSRRPPRSGCRRRR